MKSVTIRFDLHEAKLVANALQLMVDDATTPPADKLKCAKMRDLIDRELQGDPQQ